MKPDNWDSMSPEEQKAITATLFSTIRGSLIMGQALYVAVKELKKHEYPETSNIEDMEMLQTLFFPYGEIVVEAKGVMGGGA